MPAVDSLCPLRESLPGALGRPVAVLGGGITGLTAAWTLRQAGVNVAVFEAGPRVGGAINTFTSDGWMHELGPNSMLESSADVRTLIAELGLDRQVLYAAPEASKRYIVREGGPVAMPASPFSFLGTPLFSWQAKANLLGEPFRRRAPAAAEESVAEFVTRRLGSEFLDYAVNPFVGGVYAGDPRKLSVKFGFPKLWALEQEHGSLIRGAIKRRNPSGGPKGRMFSFAGGLQVLPSTMEHLLAGAVRRQHAVRGVRRSGTGWEVEYETSGRVTRETFAAVVCALPPDALAAIPFDCGTAGAALRELGRIEFAPVASVFTGYKRAAVAHPLDGFGVLVPEVERGRILGTLFSSSLFSGRAPDGHVGLTSFVGGMRQPELLERDDAELESLVQEDLERLLGVSDEPVFVHIRRWSRAIPQYTLGYGRNLDLCAAAEREAPGLFIGGNGRDGISLANCIGSGRRLAAAVLQAARR